MARMELIAAAGVAAALAAPAGAQAQSDKPAQSVETRAGPVAVDELAGGLNHPWGMAFLPDGRLLVTERAGSLRILDTSGSLSAPLDGTPEVRAQGQGGLLDVALAPDFSGSRMVYLSFAEPGEGGASTALGRGRLAEGRIEGFEVIFSQEPKVEGPNHFGGRIVFAGDGRLFLTMGERFKFDPAQDPGNHLGTIVRLEADGSVPPDNPFTDRSGAREEIWSYGHRNIESAAIDPASGSLVIAEMGPLGGDELNVPEAGRNYGWPVVSWGRHYDGRDIPDPPTREEFADALLQWTPTISPSGMLAYDGALFPEWQGSLLIGGLTASGVVRVVLDGDDAREVERIPLGKRIRDVEQAPDGSVWVLTDEPAGRIWRLRPLEKG